MKIYPLKVENVLIIPKSYFKTIWHNIKVVRDIVLLLMLLHEGLLITVVPVPNLSSCAPPSGRHKTNSTRMSMGHNDVQHHMQAKLWLTGEIVGGGLRIWPLNDDQDDVWVTNHRPRLVTKTGGMNMMLKWFGQWHVIHPVPTTHQPLGNTVTVRP